MATIGLDKLYYAKITEDENGNETYATPVQLAKAMNADLSVELAEATLYADDGAADGAKGFVGKNLCSQLNNIREGKARWYEGVQVDEVFEYDLGNTQEELDRFCAEADFVFNLAGINRPQNQEEFMQGNFGFAGVLLDTLKAHKNNCPVMLSSSAQASLTGRFGNSEYGRSKKAGEDLFLQYGREIGAKMLIYRFPNLFGKWCRPNYNSAIATFCNNIANDLPIQVNDRSVEMEVLYIDDLVEKCLEPSSARNIVVSSKVSTLFQLLEENIAFVPLPTEPLSERLWTSSINALFL